MTPEEQAAADKAAADKAESDKAAEQKAAADKAAADKAAADAKTGEDDGEVKRLRAEAEAERKKRQDAEGELKKLQKADEDRKAEELRKKGEFEELARQEREKREQAERSLEEERKARVQTAIESAAALVAQEEGLIDLDLLDKIDLKNVPVDGNGKPDVAVIKERVAAHKAAKPKLYEEPTQPRDRRTAAPAPARGGGKDADWTKKTPAEIKAERDRIVAGTF